MKKNRQAAILELVEKYDIDTQEGMLAHLKEEGFSVTQATVSRDIRELKLVKESGKDGKVRYALTAKRPTPSRPASTRCACPRSSDAWRVTTRSSSSCGPRRTPPRSRKVSAR